jgi:hypothetical protein
VATLVAHQAEYDGHLVTTEGTLRTFADRGGSYWVLEDAAGHRVALRAESASGRHAGERVRVTGTFGFDSGKGRFIDATRVTSLGDGDGS